MSGEPKHAKEKETEKENEKENGKKKDNGPEVFLAGKPPAGVLSPPKTRTLHLPLTGTDPAAIRETECSQRDCENPPFVVY